MSKKVFDSMKVPTLGTYKFSQMYNINDLTVSWGQIIGDLSDQTDLWNYLTNLFENLDFSNLIELLQEQFANNDYLTRSEANNLYAPKTHTHQYSEILNPPTIPTVPVNVSNFNNDAHYITQDFLSNQNYITSEDLQAALEGFNPGGSSFDLKWNTTRPSNAVEGDFYKNGNSVELYIDGNWHELNPERPVTVTHVFNPTSGKPTQADTTYTTVAIGSDNKITIGELYSSGKAISWEGMYGYINVQNKNLIALDGGLTTGCSIKCDEILLGTNSSSEANVQIYGTTTGTAFYERSDFRLKDITNTWVSPLSDLDKFDLVEFTWKNDDKKTPQVGVIAQEIKEIFPEAVSGTEDTHYSVDYGKLSLMALSYIKQLVTIVNNQDERIKQLESIINNE